MTSHPLNDHPHPEFPLDEDLAYLNHAAVAPWPRRARNAVAAFADENLHRGAADYPRWLQLEQRLRSNLAQLIHAEAPEDVALCKNTSEALSFVAYGLDWQHGDEIIITDQEFPSNRIVWESLKPRGVTVKVVSLAGREADPEAAIAEAFTERTQLLSVSSVQYGTGLRIHPEAMGRLCKSHGVLFCLDAIQSIGAEPLNVQEAQVDFTMADGHKWMLGPEGLALFWVNPAIRDQLTLHEFGWHMVAQRGDFDRKIWEVAPDATRFECGSPNLLAAHALQASTDVLLERGLTDVGADIRRRVRWLEEALESLPGFVPLTPAEPMRRLGIYTFRFEGVDSDELYRRLMKRGVICAHRGGGVRFSPHFYTSTQALENAVYRLKETLSDWK